MRIVVIDGLIRGLLGHGYAWARAFQHEARRRAVPIQFWVHVEAAPEVVTSLDALPIIRHSPYVRATSDPLIRELADFIEIGAAFAATLDRLDTLAIQAEDLVLLSTPRMNELHGLALWLAARGGRPVPRIAAVLHNQDLLDAHTRAPTPLAGYFRFAAREIRRHAPPGRCCLAALTRPLAQLAARMMDIPVAAVPNPSLLQDTHPVPALPSPVPDGLWRVALMGGSETRKGVGRYPGIVDGIDARRLPVRLFMQVTRNRMWTRHPDALGGIAARPWVTVHHDALDEDAYLRRLTETDIVLLPYEAEIYREMASGVLQDAAALGRAVIVPAETWMADQVAAGLAVGAVVRDGAPASYVGALAAVIEAWPQLAGRSAPAAQRWRAAHGTGAFLDAVQAALARASLARGDA